MESNLLESFQVSQWLGIIVQKCSTMLKGCKKRAIYVPSCIFKINLRKIKIQELYLLFERHRLNAEQGQFCLYHQLSEQFKAVFSREILRRPVSPGFRSCLSKPSRASLWETQETGVFLPCSFSDSGTSSGEAKTSSSFWQKFCTTADFKLFFLCSCLRFLSLESQICCSLHVYSNEWTLLRKAAF